MAMIDYAVLYDPATGSVEAMWVRAASDNISTFVADGFLEVDGVRVCDGMTATGGPYEAAVVLLTNPTGADPAIPPGVLEVNNLTTPTDTLERTDGGRYQDFEYVV